MHTISHLQAAHTCIHMFLCVYVWRVLPSFSLSISKMAVRSHCGSNGNKENIPSSSSMKPCVPFSKVSSNKKRKIRMPLADITNLHNPRCLTHSVLYNSASLLIVAILAYQEQNRHKRADASALRRSSAAAATLRKHFR